jgi:hypothetical protein
MVPDCGEATNLLFCREKIKMGGIKNVVTDFIYVWFSLQFAIRKQ